jgi:redox-sensitive bicupin YhaK (pirin superfamily)
MSAGTGGVHSEVNASQTDVLKLLQIWIETREQNIAPRYSQKNYKWQENKNSWQTVVVPDVEDIKDTVTIAQDAWIALGVFDQEQSSMYTLHKPNHNGLFVFVLEGKCLINKEELGRRDAAEVTDVESVTFYCEQPTTLLCIEVPL